MNTEKIFSIKETVNKNIERVQFPSFNNHRTLIGWAGMNYPKVLMNPQYMTKPKPKPANYDLDFLYQMRTKERQNAHLVKPFTNFIETQQNVQVEKVGSPPMGYKNSLLSLTTTKPEVKAKIVIIVSYNIFKLQQSIKGHEEYLNIRPLSCELGPKPNENFTRKIRQIGEVYYTPSYENEEIRHLKKLPNSIITEQNLIEILNQELKYLNMHNHTWISKEQVNKIGYFAPNIEELILSQTHLEDEVLVELAKSCKQLKRIDVSQCSKLTERGLRSFLEIKNSTIESFKCAHNSQSVTEYALEPLREANNLKALNVSFCNNLSSSFLQYLIDSQCKITELQMSTLEGVTAESLVQIFNQSKSTLEYLDLSFIASKEVGESIATALAHCHNLKTLILTGCTFFNDHALHRLTQGQGFKNMQMLKLGGLSNVSDGGLNAILSNCSKLKFLEVNNLERLSENSLNIITKNCSQLQIVNMNFTPNISDQGLQEKQQSFPGINFIRNINKMTDIKDDGLRMPLPLKSVVMQRPKKKKKKK